MTKLKNNQNTKSITSLGSIFASTRRKNKITIKHIANTLKVKESDIQNLENDNLSDKTPIYLNGLIKSYGKLLEINDETINEYTKNLFDKNIRNATIGKIKKNNKNYKAANKLIIYSVVILIFLYIIIYYDAKSVNLDIFNLINNYL